MVVAQHQTERAVHRREKSVAMANTKVNIIRRDANVAELVTSVIGYNNLHSKKVQILVIVK